MSWKTTLYRLLLTLLIYFCTLLQQNYSSAETTNQLWGIVSSTIAVTENQKIYLEAQPRYDLTVDDLERLQIRAAYGYKLSDNLVAWLGYVWSPGFRTIHGDSDFVNENRLWPQLTYVQKYEDFTLNHRLRFEQRRIGDEPQISNRVRYSLRGSIPLAHEGDATIGVTSYDEIFATLHGQHRGPIGGFDRNRIFLGPYIEQKHVRYEIGYLFEHTRLRDDAFRDIHALLCSIAFTF